MAPHFRPRAIEVRPNGRALARHGCHALFDFAEQFVLNCTAYQAAPAAYFVRSESIPSKKSQKRVLRYERHNDHAFATVSQSRHVCHEGQTGWNRVAADRGHGTASVAVLGGSLDCAKSLYRSCRAC
jgi:hypothetical protein